MPKQPKIQLTPYGRRYLQIARRRILRMPETFNMGIWYNHDTGVRRKRHQMRGYCGTIACIGGQVILAAGIHPESEAVIWREEIPASLRRPLAAAFKEHAYLQDSITAPVLAAHLLFPARSRQRGAAALFYETGWPEEFYNAFDAADEKSYSSVSPQTRRKLQKQKATVAAARIAHLLKEGE